MLAPIEPARTRARAARIVAAALAALLALAGAFLGAPAAFAAGEPPVAVDDSYSTPKNTELDVDALAGLKANDSDPDSGFLITSFTTPSSGTLLALDGGTGAFRYAPAFNFAGTVTFTYQVTDPDGNVGNTATVTIQVTNTAPVAVPDSYTGTVNTATSGNVLTNDTDAEGDTLSVSAWTDPLVGTLTRNSAGFFQFVPPPGGWSGTVTFSYTVNDSSVDGNTTTVTIVYGADVLPPVAAADSYTTMQDTPLTVAAPGIYANDSDADSSFFVAMLFPVDPHGTLDLDEVTGAFTYTPDVGFQGDATFRYRLNDPAGNLSGFVPVTITVLGVNVPPVAVDDSYTVAQDTALTVPAATGVLANDSDADSASWSISNTVTPLHGDLVLDAATGAFSYTPDAGWFGIDTWGYRLQDSSGNVSDWATVTITVTEESGPGNTPPVAVDDSYATPQDQVLTVAAADGILANDSDADSAAWGILESTSPGHGSLTLDTATGAFTYTPDAGWFGTDTWTYRLEDAEDALSAWATVTITVAEAGAPNQAPIAVADSYITMQGTALVVPAAQGLLANDSDPEGGALTIEVVAQPQHGALSDLDTATGAFTYTPDAGWSGTDTVTYRILDPDGAASAVATATIVVTAVTDPQQPGGDDPEPDPGSAPRPAELAETGASAELLPLFVVAGLLVVAGALGILQVRRARSNARRA
jgi:hypothetical protein